MTTRNILAWVLTGILLATGARATAAEAKSVRKIAEFRLRGAVAEAPPPDFLVFGFDADRPVVLKDLLERLKAARQDPSVAAVVLTLDEPEMGMGQMQELREALLKLRAADKDVYCHIEEVDAGMYLLASAASRLSIVPTGSIGLMGIHAESPYFKRLLDKIRIEADFEHVGEYKGAAEPLMREEPTPEAEEQLNWLVDDYYAQLVEGVAKSRGLTPEKVKSLIDEGPFTAEQALKAKLVDAVEHRQEFYAVIQRKFDTAKIVKNYGGKKGPEVDLSNPFAIFKMIGEAVKGVEEGNKPIVAVVYVDGMIVPGRSEEGMFGANTAGSTTIRAALDKAREDEKVKAVVLRVDSPGGSATASEIIWNAARLCGREKPLVVSMGNVAASGGYYVSCGAEAIFADAGTLTGSIGVVGGKIVTKGLWDWVGMTFHETKRGRNADLFNTNRKFDDRERAIVRKMMEDTYAIFTGHVREGRGEKLTADIEAIARGRVYTGRMAQAKGLVDKIGGLDDAIRYAADEANISDYQVRVMPRPKNFLDIFARGLGFDEDDDASAPRGRRWPIAQPALEMLAPTLRQIDAAKARTIARHLLRLDLLHREHVLMVLPTDVLINGIGY